MKNKSLLALLAIPLAGLGIVGSAALAANKAQPTVSATPATIEAQKSSQTGGAATITSDQAKKIAEAKFSGTASSVSVDDDQVNGHVAYEVKIDGQEVKIDGQSGAIVSSEKDDGDSTSQDKETKDDGGKADLETNDDGANAQ